jgi:hypothetical protein
MTADRTDTVAATVNAPIARHARPGLHRPSPVAAFSLALVMTMATLSGIHQLAQPEGAEWLWSQPASSLVRA